MVAGVRGSHTRWAAGVFLAALAGAQIEAWAETHVVAPQPGSLRHAIAAAAPGDEIVVLAGVHDGPLVIDKPLVLSGQEGAVVDGGGTGSVITLTVPDTRVTGLTVIGSGISLFDMDSGVFVTKAADRAVVEDNRFEGNLFGVYLHGPSDAIVRGNMIVGRDDLRMSERGNGVSVWNSPGSVVDGNVVRLGRDGIFVNTSRNNRFTRNRFENLRFGVHYMYANDSTVADNVSVGNHVGYAIMFSARLTVSGNVSEGDRDHGLLLNYTNESLVAGNRVRDGGEKCVFIYNSSKNVFRGNRFEGCEIGVHFTAGSERNAMTENAFVANRTQVKYVGTRWLEWSLDGRGNYWSDNPAFDLDGDGIADAAYRPNDIVDRIVWTQPAAKLLLTSPAVQLLRHLQGQFPALHPGGVVDSAPLMRPPAGG